MTNEEKLVAVNAYTKVRGIHITFSFGSPIPGYKPLYYNIAPDWKATLFAHHAYINPVWASQCSVADLLEQVRRYMSSVQHHHHDK
jgi:hypothetical protein